MAVPAAASPKNAEKHERVLRITIEFIEHSLQLLKTQVYDRGLSEPYKSLSGALHVLFKNYTRLCAVI